MNNLDLTSLKGAFKKAAGSMAATVSVSAAIAMSGPVAAAAAPVMVAGSALGGLMGLAAATLGKYNPSPLAGAIGVTDAAEAPPAAGEIEISVETGAPVKAMKRIRFRR